MSLCRPTWTATALLLVLAVPSSLAQYYSGYGTGPYLGSTLFSLGQQQQQQQARANDPNLQAAKQVTLWMIRSGYLDNNNNARSIFVPQVESPYKYRRPLFPTRYRGFGVTPRPLWHPIQPALAPTLAPTLAQTVALGLTPTAPVHFGNFGARLPVF